MGTRYEAYQEDLNRRVAVKVLPKELARDPAFVKRFRREAPSAASLNHPNIVTVYDTGEDHAFHYFSMELARGISGSFTGDRRLDSRAARRDCPADDGERPAAALSRLGRVA